MNIIRSSTYRKMQAGAAKWLRRTYRTTLFGFDTRIQGKYYSVVGIDVKNQTYAVIIFETSKDFLNRKTEVITARGKFGRVFAMFPNEKIFSKLNIDLGSIGVLLAETDSWRGAYRMRGGNWCYGSKMISTEKLKDCILRRNSESLYDLVEWVGNHKGKSIDSAMITNLRLQCSALSKELEIEKDKGEIIKERGDAFAIFASKFVTDNTRRLISKMGSRSYSSSKTKKKETSKQIENNGCSVENLLSAIRGLEKRSQELDAICTTCDINKSKSSYCQQHWSDNAMECANCKLVPLQSYMVNKIHKYEALCAKKMVSKERALK